MLQIYCKNTKSTKSFIEGTSLLEILDSFEFERPYQIVSAKVNNISQGLKFKVYNNRDVEFLDASDASGRRVYRRSLCFLLYKAVSDLFPGSKIYVKHPVSHGYYCSLEKLDSTPVTPEDIYAIKERMAEIVRKDMPFRRSEVQTEEAIRIFSEKGAMDKVRLIETSGEVYMDYYTLGATTDYYYGRLVPSTGYLKVWDIIPYHEGMLLRIPKRDNPDELAEFIDQPKTFSVFAEDYKWNTIMGLRNVGDVNLACQNGQASDLIQVSEALQEKKIVQIAEEILRRYNDPEKPVRLVLITGPSSSGKTTVTRRLSVQLKACGLRPMAFSTDDYFVNRVDTPLLPDGSYDFDNLKTVDCAALERDLIDLIAGKEVEVPEYNFVTGKREYNGKKLCLKPQTVIILEGIHALNPALTEKIEDSLKFKIFISTLTSIALDDHNWIPTSDNRLLRRIIRDSNKGAFTPMETIRNWQNVRRSEHKWITPFQENADVLFNSAYLIEFAVLRNHAEPLLRNIPKNCPEYGEAHRLLKFLHYFTPVSDNEIPPTSLLREFVGGSVYSK